MVDGIADTPCVEVRSPAPYYRNLLIVFPQRAYQDALAALAVDATTLEPALTCLFVQLRGGASR